MGETLMLQTPQYHPPYMPPNVTPYYGAPANPLRHAKRASLAMLIIGPLMLACGVCAGIMPMVVSAMPADESKQIFDQMQSSYQMPTSELLSKLLISGIFFAVIGIAFTVLGVIVRRGGRVSAVLASVLTSLVLLNLIGGMLAGLAGFGGGGPLAFLMQLMMTAVFGSLMYFLIQAARASTTIKQAQQQFQAEYWQYQQNMHAYSQPQAPGYTGGYPPGYPPIQGYAPPAQMPPGYPPLQGYAQASQPPVPPPPEPTVPPAD